MGGAEYVTGGKLHDIWEESSMLRGRSRVTYRKSQVCHGSPPATYKKVLMAGCQAKVTSLYALLLVTNRLILSTVAIASKLQG